MKRFDGEFSQTTVLSITVLKVARVTSYIFKVTTPTVPVMM